MSPTRSTGLVAAAALAVSACVTQPPRPPAPPGPVTLELPERIAVRVAGRIESIPLDDYVVGTVLAEISPVDETPATARRVFEVQSVLARTYALANLGRHAAEGFDLCDSTHCQVYEPGRLQTSRFADIARQAVADTHNRILAFGTRPAQTLFHADCGGMLAAADDVWAGDPIAYLRGGPDDVPSDTHRHWQFEASRDDLRRALDADPRSEVGDVLAAIRPVLIDASGRAARIEVDGGRDHVLRGDQFRAILNATFGATALRSTRFTVDETPDGFRFTGTGYGHGVGLCQVGAMARARRGESLTAILDAYYPGTRLVTGRPALSR